VVAVLVVIAVLVMLAIRLRRSRHSARLRRRFGPEYDMAVRRLGRTQGERHLESRLHDHGQRRIRSVTPEEREAALRSFEAVQTSFVETPVGAVRAADQLVFDVLRERGYPLETVDDRASAVSVDDPELAYRYREAQSALARAESTAQGSDGPDIDRLRAALLTYRDLLHELVDAPRVQGRLTTSAGADRSSTASSTTDSPRTDERRIDEGRTDERRIDERRTDDPSTSDRRSA